MRIADLEKVLDGKLSASFLPPSPRKRSRQMSVGLILIFAGIGAALVGAIFVTSDRSLPPSQQPAPVVPSPTQPPADGPAKSVLLSSRYYSAKNKEEVAALVDKISDKLNKPGEEIFLLAQRATGGYLWSRPDAALSYLQHIDQIKADAAQIDAFLYDGLVQDEREYREEINAILFPKDPLVRFRIAVDDYRTGLSTWIKMRDSAPAETREDLQQLVTVSQRAFVAARDELIKWFERRQELIRQTRSALKS